MYSQQEKQQQQQRKRSKHDAIRKVKMANLRKKKITKDKGCKMSILLTWIYDKTILIYSIYLFYKKHIE